MNVDQLPQSNIRVEVDFYDDTQREKLLEYPSAQKLVEIVESGIQIPTQEFLTYYLFHKKRPGKPGYRNYHDLGMKIGKSLSELEDWINFNQTSICVPVDSKPQLPSITERIGESIGLSVVNRIHNLTEADWGKLPEISGRRGQPTFDYQVASDGKNIVQVETKGSCSEDNRQKTSSVSNAMNSIGIKKEKIEDSEKADGYRYPAELRYGTITVLGYSPGSVARCWLLDPEPDSFSTPPEQLKLINRMSFLRDWISFISPRSQFAAALSTRVGDLQSVTNPMELDGVALRKGNGDELVIESPDPWGRGGSSFFLNKSRVSDGPSVGVVIQTSYEALTYLGIRSELAVLAGAQDFQAILRNEHEMGTVEKTIECTVSDARFQRLNLPLEIKEQAVRSGNYFTFKLAGPMHYSKEGLIFGRLPFMHAQSRKETARTSL